MVERDEPTVLHSQKGLPEKFEAMLSLLEKSLVSQGEYAEVD